MRLRESKGWLLGGYKWIAPEPYLEVAEHRYLMEQYLGRKLTTDECVHHKNGNKTDNRLCNLEIVDRAEHTKLHRQIPPKLRVCENCGVEFTISKRFNYKERKTCSRKCQGEQMWRTRRANKT